MTKDGPVDKTIGLEAPDCRGCGRRMAVEAYNYGINKQTREVSKYVGLAKCECCPIYWSPERGWQYDPNENGCEHIDFECLDEPCPNCEAPQLWSFAGIRTCPACGWEDAHD